MWRCSSRCKFPFWLCRIRGLVKPKLPEGDLNVECVPEGPEDEAEGQQQSSQVNEEVPGAQRSKNSQEEGDEPGHITQHGQEQYHSTAAHEPGDGHGGARGAGSIPRSLPACLCSAVPQAARRKYKCHNTPCRTIGREHTTSL